MNDKNLSSPEEEGPSERDKLIAQMEKDLARPHVGLLPPVAALGVVAAAALGFWMRADVAYFFSTRVPIELGAEGNYSLEAAASNRYAQVRGVPSARGWYVEEKDGSFVVVGLTDVPLLVKRTAFEDEKRRLPEGKRPQPRQTPFFARGRLLSRQDAEQYEEVFREYEQWSGGKAQWLLKAEEPPGKDFSTVAMFGFVVLFGAVNGWLFVRGLTLRRR